MKNIEQILGLTLTKIDKSEDQILFFTSAGDTFRRYHNQDCCESVSGEVGVGDRDELIGSPITMASEEASQDIIDGKPAFPDSFTWTFYKLATVKGYVTIRWLGQSNGYYSEGVSFVTLEP